MAGLTLALQNTKLIALSGLITGVSATLSMASSEFLSARSEGREDAFKSCVYTGIAYCITVALLVLPYLVFDDEHYLHALGTMLVTVVLIILVLLIIFRSPRTWILKSVSGRWRLSALALPLFPLLSACSLKRLWGSTFDCDVIVPA